MNSAELKHLDPEDPEERAILLQNHDLLRRSYTIPTPSMIAVAETAALLIERRRPGAAFAGPSRTGKTVTISYLTEKIAEAYPNVCVLTLLATESERPSGKHVVREAMAQLGLRIDIRNRGVPLQRLNDELLLRMEGRKSDQLVIFVDEGQKWGLEEYGMLADITNGVAKNSYKSTVLTVGQSELIHLKTACVASMRADLIGRFFSRIYEFRGVATPEEARTILEQYDTALQYPSDSGWSFTRFFFPEAFENGFRLARSARLLWNAFHQMPGIAEKQDIGMEYFCAAVEYALLTFGLKDGPKFVFNAKEWLESVEQWVFRANVTGRSGAT